MHNKPGMIVLLGSGETLPSSRSIHEQVFKSLPPEPLVKILETPAGFEPNSDKVAGRIKQFLEHSLQNYRPQVEVIPARKKGGQFSPDDEKIVSPLLDADEILLGPGSPTYAAKQLSASLAIEMVSARVQLGAALFLSSSATLAFGSYTMPVYEIYKVGEDLHWQPGIGFFELYGLKLAVIPHWDNNDGGDDLDTSRCYLGAQRFNSLYDMLPEDVVVVGIDEHTGLVLDFENGCCDVMGKGGVSLVRNGKETIFRNGDELPLEHLGDWRIPEAGAGLSETVWQQAIHRHQQMIEKRQSVPVPGGEVIALADARAEARNKGKWEDADNLRDQIADLGWQVNDNSEGYRLIPLKK